MPYPFEDEGGEVWYIHGHVSDRQGVVSVALLLHTESFENRDEAYRCVDGAKVERLWFIADEADEERMTRCRRWSRGAEPWTRVSVAS